jgi:ribonucleoside-diphosphate reductase alpha chain
MPRETRPDEIAEAYLDGWRLGLKALAIYRDGSKESQPLSTSTEGDKAKDKEAEKTVAKPYRRRLPDTRQSLTHKFDVAGHEGYVTVGLYDDGRPGELFITMAKEGSTIGGLMDAFGTAVSMSLQFGVPLEDYVRKFSHMRFEPQGFTKNPDIRIAKSLIDYIFRWLGMTFLPGYKEASQGKLGPDLLQTGDRQPGEGGSEDAEPQHLPVATKAGGLTVRQDANLAGPTAVRGGQPSGRSNGHSADYNAKLLERAGLMVSAGPLQWDTRSHQFADFQVDAPACDNCGAITVRNGNCYLCHNCGSSMGCS